MKTIVMVLVYVFVAVVMVAACMFLFFYFAAFGKKGEKFTGMKNVIQKARDYKAAWRESKDTPTAA